MSHITHHTCPSAPAEGMTHHLAPHRATVVVQVMRCLYCGKDEPALRTEAEEIERSHPRWRSPHLQEE
jgi:hypothetical protein